MQLELHRLAKWAWAWLGSRVWATCLGLRLACCNYNQNGTILISEAYGLLIGLLQRVTSWAKLSPISLLAKRTVLLGAVADGILGLRMGCPCWCELE